MNEEMMTAGTGGFSGSAAATGPNAGYDPVLNFKKKVQKRKKKVQKESRENPTTPSRLFQYKVNVPGIGDTIIFANSPAELKMKLRLMIMPQYRNDISIERILPANAARFFMDKRMKAMKNVSESAEAQMKQKQAMMKIAIEKKKVQMKKQEMAKQLQMKTAQLKKQARAGAEQDATRT
jgi:hypothetical protein|tara:strand:+ start:336 stop:872 length:537 start_codon:yes stop_codon:yes gene_type:complete